MGCMLTSSLYHPSSSSVACLRHTLLCFNTELIDSYLPARTPYIGIYIPKKAVRPVQTGTSVNQSYGYQVQCTAGWPDHVLRLRSITLKKCLSQRATINFLNTIGCNCHTYDFWIAMSKSNWPLLSDHVGRETSAWDRQGVWIRI